MSHIEFDKQDDCQFTIQWSDGTSHSFDAYEVIIQLMNENLIDGNGESPDTLKTLKRFRELIGLPDMAMIQARATLYKAGDLVGDAEGKVESLRTSSAPTAMTPGRNQVRGDGSDSGATSDASKPVGASA